MSKRVDLRSDTVTQPTAAMRQSMLHAELGDDVFGEDPTVNALQARAANIFGREAALFVPSGTMANQIAIRSHTNHGDEVVAGRWAHAYYYEGGAAAALSGVQVIPVGTNGTYTLEEARAVIRPPDVHHPPTRLMLFENTHNRGGGIVFPLADLQELSTFARANGIKTHMDGARIFNACVATGNDPRVYGGLVDTLSFCLSKGLGAPVGSLLVGDRATIEVAHRYRKMYGGAMRQAGILAAAGLYALDQHRSRLVEDHAHAKRFAEGLKRLQGVTIAPDPMTNIVFFTLAHPDFNGPELCQALAELNVFLLPMSDTRLRAVFHLDVSGAQVDYALKMFEEVLGKKETAEEGSPTVRSTGSHPAVRLPPKGREEK